MIHDPLCPVQPKMTADITTHATASVVYESVALDTRCECDLIAKVRADMVQRLVETSYYINPTDPAEQGYNAGREIAIEVLSNAFVGS